VTVALRRKERAIPTLDYHTPEPPKQPKGPFYGACVGGCLGAGLLGVVLPLMLAVYCALVLNDMGGPLFLPIIAIAGGTVGLLAGALVGLVVRFVRRRRRAGRT
jgi:hypothetical protein